MHKSNGHARNRDQALQIKERYLRVTYQGILKQILRLNTRKQNKNIRKVVLEIPEWKLALTESGMANVSLEAFEGISACGAKLMTTWESRKLPSFTEFKYLYRR